MFCGFFCLDVSGNLLILQKNINYGQKQQERHII